MKNQRENQPNPPTYQCTISKLFPLSAEETEQHQVSQLSQKHNMLSRLFLCVVVCLVFVFFTNI